MINLNVHYYSDSSVVKLYCFYQKRERARWGRPIFLSYIVVSFFFFFQAEDGIRDLYVTGVQTCALPISQRLRAIGFDGHASPAPVATLTPAELGRDGVEIDRQAGGHALENRDERFAVQIGRASCRERV